MQPTTDSKLNQLSVNQILYILAWPANFRIQINAKKLPSCTVIISKENMGACCSAAGRPDTLQNHCCYFWSQRY